ncbi:periplasmic protein disulfide isomerase I [Serratia symbiotica str. 'Cinara cedri']|nr:periplasmic protein disulfide isomerase I [Serratia symbiotica str. 'Cinara cedri']
MKKIWLIFLNITIVFNVMALQFSEGNQYISLDKPLTSNPQILEFFSFYCSHCYQFEQVYQLSDNIKKMLPANTKITRYHVNFLGSLGKPLTQAWAVAIALSVEDKVSPLMFETIQKTQVVKTPDDIRNIFIKAGVNAVDYDAALNSFVVKYLVLQQEQAAENLHLNSVPAVFVNGKYMIKNNGLDSSSMDVYVQQFSDVVKFLSQQSE